APKLPVTTAQIPGETGREGENSGSATAGTRDLNLVVDFGHAGDFLGRRRDVRFLLLVVHRAAQGHFTVLGLDLDVLCRGGHRRVLPQGVLDTLGGRTVSLVPRRGCRRRRGCGAARGLRGLLGGGGRGLRR